MLAVSEEEAQHSSLLRARRAALVVVSAYASKGQRAGERPLFFGARPWCDVLAAVYNAKPAPRVSCSAGASALADSREEAQSSSLQCARALPRWMCTTHGV